MKTGAGDLLEVRHTIRLLIDEVEVGGVSTDLVCPIQKAPALFA